MHPEELARIRIAELMAEAEAERLARTAQTRHSAGAAPAATLRSARLIAVVICVLIAALRLVAIA